MSSKIGIRSENEFRLLEKLLIRSKLVEKMKNPSLDPVLVLKEEVPIDSRYQTLIEEEFEDILYQKKKLNIFLITLAFFCLMVVILTLYIQFLYNPNVLIEYIKSDEINYVELISSGYITCSSKLHCLAQDYSIFKYVYLVIGSINDLLSTLLEFWLSSSQN